MRLVKQRLYVQFSNDYIKYVVLHFFTDMLFDIDIKFVNKNLLYIVISLDIPSVINVLIYRMNSEYGILVYYNKAFSFS